MARLACNRVASARGGAARFRGIVACLRAGAMAARTAMSASAAALAAACVYACRGRRPGDTRHRPHQGA